jgi:hypothetical protein
MAQKFNLNTDAKYDIVVDRQESSDTASVLATSLRSRIKNPKTKYHSQRPVAQPFLAPSKGHPMSQHSRVWSVNAGKLRLLISGVVAVLCLLALMPTSSEAQTVLPTIIKLPPFSSLMPSSQVVAELAIQEDADTEQLGAAAVMSKIAALSNAEVRATELRGLLPHQFDHHYFGLEAFQPNGGFAVTLVVEPATALVENSVNFVVLTEDGLNEFLAGADPMTVKTAMGMPLLFDQLDNRLTALVPGVQSNGYTVMVYNNGKLPVTYTLHVEGGLLRDDAGQTFSSVKVNAPNSESASVDTSVQEVPVLAMPVSDGISALQPTPKSEHDGAMKRLFSSDKVSSHVLSEESPSSLATLMPEPVRARRVSGALLTAQDRHYLNLAADAGAGDITLTLRYMGAGDAPSQLNFWVMTQDGVRHLIQGGLAQELNLATGLPLGGEEGTYQARLRLAKDMLYTVIVFNGGESEGEYALSVEGGILVDRYGQTREAQATTLELMALASE